MTTSTLPRPRRSSTAAYCAARRATAKRQARLVTLFCEALAVLAIALVAAFWDDPHPYASGAVPVAVALTLPSIANTLLTRKA